MSLYEEIVEYGKRAVIASRELATLTSREKNNILLAMADELEKRKQDILISNAKDVAIAKSEGFPSAFIDRLLLTESRINDMIKSIQAIAALKDPIGTKISRWFRPNGLEIVKVRVPIGVIAIIYESRPNVTVDSAALCLKSSNAVILRGGTESFNSNATLVDILHEAGRKKRMPENAIQLIRTQDREAVKILVQLEEYVNLVIPRGGESLIKAVTQDARVPVIKHYKGNCHIYVDESADIDMAVNIIENAKCQRPGVCNAVEKLLIHSHIAEKALPKIANVLGKHGVEIRGDERTCKILPGIKLATEEDWYTEYLALIIAIRIVDSVEEAIDHINKYGSHHSDAIISKSKEAQKIFTDRVDSAAVYINASTRFTDGGEFGMGAEIGISTDKIHARGPMGLEELTTYKYVIFGNGQIRS